LEHFWASKRLAILCAPRLVAQQSFETMALARRTVFLSILQACTCATYPPPARPFAFHHFAADDKKEGVRRFAHSEYVLLPNYTTLEMRWDAHVDPDTILAMDVEHENGVRLAACQPNQLVLHLPPAYVSKVKKWQHVTATNGFHVCDHAKDRPVYHRIKEVELTKHHETPKGGRTAVLTTQELDSPSEVIPQLDFAYSLIPIESLKEHEQEAAKNLYDERLRAMTEHSDRRLYDRNFDDDEGYGKFERSKNQLKGYNDFSPAAAGTDDRNWRPLSHAKFGWNWNYRTNTVRNPQFIFHIPSIRGIALLKNPFLKFVGGLNVQFQSQWDDVNPFQTPPREIGRAHV